MFDLSPTKEKGLYGLQSAEPFYQHYTGVAAITQEREVTINKTNCANHQPTVLYRRIGSTTYKVRVHFSDTGTETMNDKIVRLIQNEALTSAPDCAITRVCHLKSQNGAPSDSVLCCKYALFLVFTGLDKF